MPHTICADHLCEYRVEINGVVLGIYSRNYPEHLWYILRADQWRCPVGLERIYQGFGQGDYNPNEFDLKNHVKVVL